VITATAPRPGPPSTIAFERLVAGVAARFVNIRSEDLDAAIVESQRQIVEALDLDRSTLFQAMPDGTVRFTHAWTRPEHAVPLPTVSADTDFPWLLARVRAGEPAIIDDIDEDHAESALDRANLKTYGTKSTVILPLRVGQQFVGTLSFASIRAVRPASSDQLDRMRLVAHVFAQALQHRRQQDALEASLAEVSRLRDLLARDNAILRREVRTLSAAGLVAAESPSIRRVMEMVEQVAPTRATVLLLGETGSGKDVFAREIHQRSTRHHKPMVTVNCGSIPAALIESELFGRERGAYTGAVSRQIGRFELAHGSTIFLDEIGDLPLDAQVKLLRVVEDCVVERLGGSEPHTVDVRIIAATNRPLEQAVATGTFREDLYYRLNVFPITVPPLRDRVGDIPTLVWTFVEEFAKSFGKPITSVSRASLDALAQHGWPGNVRELRNAVEHAMILATGPHLVIPAPGVRAAGRQKSLRLADVEAAHILGVLERTGWRVRGPQGAADLLGLKPTTLEGRMARLGLRRAPA
jgi:formate hydrogenlyase transcriptional activator